MSGSTPAWGLDSVVLRLDAPLPVAVPTPEWAFGSSTGAGVRVAVVDSGIEADHPALDDAVDRDGGVDVQVDPDGGIAIVAGPHTDVFGHGTACAGIIHALAPDARITSVRVLGPDLTGRAAGFHAGLAWAVDEGFDVINLSLGTTKPEWALAFHEVCDRAYFSGSFVVTAANNTRRTSYPSLFASVASVACTTSRDPLRFHANPAPPTEFLARGIDVEVPWLGGTTTTSTGNSYAAPHIAGLAALIKAEHPELRPFQVKGLLWATAANVREALATGGPVESTERAGSASARPAPGTAAAMTQVIRLPPSEVPGAPPVPAPPPPPSSTGPPPSGGAPTWQIGGYEAAGAATRSPWGVSIPARRGDQEVVVHDLRPSLAVPADAPRVVAAVHAAAAIAHPHLEPVLDVVVTGGPMVVTAVAGRLDDGPLDLPDALAVALAVLAGLDTLHANGLVHGDVRVDGLRRDGQGGVRLGWSGVAAALGRPPAVGSAARHAAALAHLAPERLEGAPADARGDVYGVGLLLATLLAGHPPFPPADDPLALPGQRSTSPPAVSLPDGRPLPADLAAALAAALAPDPAARPRDAATFSRVLAWAADDAVGLERVAASPLLRVAVAR